MACRARETSRQCGIRSCHRGAAVTLTVDQVQHLGQRGAGVAEACLHPLGEGPWRLVRVGVEVVFGLRNVMDQLERDRIPYLNFLAPDEWVG